jgi:hypothetical protein
MQTRDVEILAPGSKKSDAKGKGNAWAVGYGGGLRYALGTRRT